MEKRSFGQTGMQVGVLGFGGSEIGWGGAPQADVDQLLNEALDLGLNVIDTAECYVDSEEKIGKAVSHRRSEFFLFTKTGHSSGFEEPDWDPTMLMKQIDRSLQRLQTDRVDLLQLHSCSLDLLRQGDVIEVLETAKAAGKTRFIGYSGDNEAARFAVECGRFDALQCTCNIADQECIDLFLPLAQAKGMGVIAKRPIANAAWIRNLPEGTYGHEFLLRLKKLQYPLLSEPAEVALGKALNFTLAQPGISTAIVGTKQPGRFAANLKSMGKNPISPEEIEEIRRRWMEIREGDWVGRG